MYDPKNGLPRVHSLQGFQGVGGEAVGELVGNRWAEWVDTRKKGGYGGGGAGAGVHEGVCPKGGKRGNPPKRAKKEPSQRGHRGDVPVPPPPPPAPALSCDDLARQVTAKCRDGVTRATGVAVRDIVPAHVRTALDRAMKG